MKRKDDKRWGGGERWSVGAEAKRWRYETVEQKCRCGVEEVQRWRGRKSWRGRDERWRGDEAVERRRTGREVARKWRSRAEVERWSGEEQVEMERGGDVVERWR